MKDKSSNLKSDANVLRISRNILASARSMILHSVDCFVTGCPVLCVCVAFLLVSPDSMAGGDYRFQNENLALIRDIDAILVRNNLCEDIPHCSSKSINFSMSTSWGLDVEIYGITDPEIIKQIDAACAEYFHRRTPHLSIRVRFFSVTKAEDVKASIFSKPKPIVIINREHTDVER